MPYCPDCDLAWGGESVVPTVCLTCRCARAEGKLPPRPLNPWAKTEPLPPPPPKPPAPPSAPPLQAAATAFGKLGDAVKGAGASVAQAAAAFELFGQVTVHHPPPSSVPWIASGHVMSPDPGSSLHELDHPARLCTCDHWEEDHDRLGCKDCDTCDAFVLQAAADAIEQVGSMHPDDYHPIGHHVRLEDGRRVEMRDIAAASAVLTRRAQANRPALPQHRRGLHLRGIKQKKEEGT